MKVAFIGAGAMGFSLARAALSSKVLSAEQVTIVETSEERRALAASEFSCEVFAAIGAAPISNCSIILLAVKPQDAHSVCEDLKRVLNQNQIVLSIMAGITRERLSAMLGGHKFIVRAMPNLPAQIQRGMTVYCPSQDLESSKLDGVVKLLACAGETLRLDDEGLLDAATAVSGSGPGYVFYIVEHLITAAQRLGFSNVEATLLVMQTLTGALELWRNSGKNPAELRALVTSKGGTTHAALEVFVSGALGDVLQRGIMRAAERSRELSAVPKVTDK